MEPGRLSRLSRLGGKVVEIRLNDNRRAIGFLVKADNDKIVLHPIDHTDQATSTTYRTSRSRDFDCLGPGEAITFDPEMLPPRTRLLITLVNNFRVCGYRIPAAQKSILLARELADNGEDRRAHRHLPEHIARLQVLKPVADEP